MPQVHLISIVQFERNLKEKFQRLKFNFVMASMHGHFVGIKLSNYFNFSAIDPAYFIVMFPLFLTPSHNHKLLQNCIKKQYVTSMTNFIGLNCSIKKEYSSSYDM